MQVRTVTIDDLDTICRHRENMFREAGREESVLASMTPAFRTWLASRLAEQRYFGFLLSDNDTVVAGIGLMEIDWPPHPSHPEQDKRGYVLNVYVEPSHRKQGLASQLMALAEDEFKRRGIGFAILHATQMGRPLYEANGWLPTTEMSKTLG